MFTTCGHLAPNSCKITFPTTHSPGTFDLFRMKLNESMNKAGMEEKRLAEENDDYH